MHKHLLTEEPVALFPVLHSQNLNEFLTQACNLQSTLLLTRKLQAQPPSMNYAKLFSFFLWASNKPLKLNAVIRKTEMYIILVIFHVLFEFTENLALGVRLPSHFRP